ncbi:MAG: HAD-IIIC family phosphatase [Candidatus Acidiferrales bacterium]
MSHDQSKSLRTQIETFLGDGRWTEAHARLGELWRREGKPATAGYVASCYERMKERLPLVHCKICLLRSMTLEPLVPILRGTALVSGIDASIQVGQFNFYAQEILDSSSALYSFNPDIVVLAVQTRDVMPEISEGYADLSPAAVQAAIDRVVESFATWIRAFRDHSNASLVVHNLEKPPASQGVLDAQGENGQLAAIDQVNAKLRAICREHRGVYVLDYDGLVSRHGAMRWHDESKWLTMRMPFAADSLLPMVSEWMKFIHPLTGTICKVLAVDLDNTLWGGVLGEDGMEGIKLGPEYPGAFYRALQRAILDLYRRGILLAVCSKNNHDEAMSALQRHPEMLLRPEHFAAFRINWQDKAQNLREIAVELNLGTDAVAFLDDNPVERERVRSAMPEVKVIEVPDLAQGFAKELRDSPFFERLTLSAEDRELTRMYHERQERSTLARSSASLEDFYRSLEQEILIAPVLPETVARVAQLTQKTNQYNVTTRRYTEPQIEEFAGRPGWEVFSVRVKDRFGDNGIVGVLISRTENDLCDIDTFLLSCRVIGRRIETAMLRFAAERSKAQGARFLQGWFVPTKKNGPVRDLYSSHNFKAIATKDTDATLWRLDLAAENISCPEWIRVHVTSDSYRAEQARA